jgi:hypothetical protein
MLISRLTGFSFKARQTWNPERPAAEARETSACHPSSGVRWSDAAPCQEEAKRREFVRNANSWLWIALLGTWRRGYGSSGVTTKVSRTARATQRDPIVNMLRV